MDMAHEAVEEAAFTIPPRHRRVRGCRIVIQLQVSVIQGANRAVTSYPPSASRLTGGEHVTCSSWGQAQGNHSLIVVAAAANRERLAAGIACRKKPAPVNRTLASIISAQDRRGRYLFLSKMQA